MTWAFGLPLKPATAKFILVALADNADDSGRAFPSLGCLIEKTSLDRKTVISGLDQLEKLNLLIDTGARVGRTKQIKVYRLNGFKSPYATPDDNDSESGTVQTVPKFPANSTEIPSKETRFSQETVPKTEPGTLMESSSEPSGNRREVRAARSTLATRLPPDFGLTPERRAVAEAEKADPDREFAQFTDHFRAAPGVKGRKNDWDATWRNWCRRAPDFKPRANGAPTSAPALTWRPPAEEEDLDVPH
jgi:hypothetical protein